jgi:Na+-transporting NADH:ubiquinone oxidoreductase subunit NqrB
LTGVGVARWKAWPAVEKCLLKFSIMVDLSVVTVFLIFSAVGSWHALSRFTKGMCFVSTDFFPLKLTRSIFLTQNVGNGQR